MVDQNKNFSGSREDDYRDFEERNIGDGWPYADGSGEGATEPENRAYGETRANFENERNSGFRVDGTDMKTGLKMFLRILFVQIRSNVRTVMSWKLALTRPWKPLTISTWIASTFVQTMV